MTEVKKDQVQIDDSAVLSDKEASTNVAQLSSKSGKKMLNEDDYTGRQNKGFFSALNSTESE
jgi:hypothetical protein